MSKGKQHGCVWVWLQKSLSRVIVKWSWKTAISPHRVSMQCSSAIFGTWLQMPLALQCEWEVKKSSSPGESCVYGMCGMHQWVGGWVGGACQ